MKKILTTLFYPASILTNLYCFQQCNKAIERLNDAYKNLSEEKKMYYKVRESYLKNNLFYTSEHPLLRRMSTDYYDQHLHLKATHSYNENQQKIPIKEQVKNNLPSPSGG